jgi:hypothetical protein
MERCARARRFQGWSNFCPPPCALAGQRALHRDETTGMTERLELLGHIEAEGLARWQHSGRKIWQTAARTCRP